jgi:hypothetical protein
MGNDVEIIPQSPARRPLGRDDRKDVGRIKHGNAPRILRKSDARQTEAGGDFRFSAGVIPKKTFDRPDVVPLGGDELGQQ